MQSKKEEKKMHQLPVSALFQVKTNKQNNNTFFILLKTATTYKSSNQRPQQE